MSEKEKQIPPSYKLGLAIGFILLLIGGILYQIGNCCRYYYFNWGERTALMVRTIGISFLISGDFVIAILVLLLALNPQLIESETVRNHLFLLVGILLVLGLIIALSTPSD